MLKLNHKSPKPERQIVEDKLKTIMKEINNGVDFSKLVETYSEDKNKKVSPQQRQKGLLRWNPGTADDPVHQKAFTMKVGEISEPIKTKKGYSIIKVIEIIKKSGCFF